MIIGNGISRVEIGVFGTTWIWPDAQNDFVPEFKGKMCGAHIIYEYPNKTLVAQPMNMGW